MFQCPGFPRMVMTRTTRLAHRNFSGVKSRWNDSRPSTPLPHPDRWHEGCEEECNKPLPSLHEFHPSRHEPRTGNQTTRQASGKNRRFHLSSRRRLPPADHDHRMDLDRFPELNRGGGGCPRGPRHSPQRSRHFAQPSGITRRRRTVRGSRSGEPPDSSRKITNL